MISEGFSVELVLLRDIIFQTINQLLSKVCWNLLFN